MGTVIGSEADLERTEEHIREAHEKAVARGGEIAKAAEERLGPSITAIDNTVTTLKAAKKAESTSWATVDAMDKVADPGVGGVRDAMWTALGRPRQHAAMDEVYPGGVATYTKGDLRQQPLLMEVLRTRILASSAPQWVEAKRQAWAAEIEALRAPYAAAVDAHRPLEAALTVAETSYRAAVRSGRSRLMSFKRDLESLGLTEKQIHEIIPDATPRPKGGGPSDDGGEKDGDSGSDATAGGGKTGGGDPK